MRRFIKYYLVIYRQMEKFELDFKSQFFFQFLSKNNSDFILANWEKLQLYLSFVLRQLELCGNVI